MGVSLLLALKALVGLLSIVEPSRVVDSDLVARSRRFRAGTASNNLSLNTHLELWLCRKVKAKKVREMKDEVRFEGQR